MRRKRHDPSVTEEPQFADRPLRADPGEARARSPRPGGFASEADRVLHGVWEEPALSPELVGGSPSGPGTYAAWLSGRLAATSALRSWLVTLLVVAFAGVAAVPAAMLTNTAAGLESSSFVLLVVLLAPAGEEVLKVGLAWWVVEKRPYLFRHASQIVLCAAAGGLVFGLLENLWYVHVVFPEGVSAGAIAAEDVSGLSAWRWSVCTAMHATASTIAGLGLARAWRAGVRDLVPPPGGRAMPLLVAAIAVHATYNGGALLFELGRRVV